MASMTGSWPTTVLLMSKCCGLTTTGSSSLCGRRLGVRSMLGIVRSMDKTSVGAFTGAWIVVPATSRVQPGRRWLTSSPKRMTSWDPRRHVTDAFVGAGAYDTNDVAFSLLR